MTEKMRRYRRGAAGSILAGGLCLLFALAPTSSRAAGTLTPVGSGQQPMRITEHHLQVVIDNGFARTEVTQTFHNPNTAVVEALYAFPVPKSASLSEMTITSGEMRLEGEVVAKEQAKTIYEEEQSNGNQAGRADKESYQRFEFRVARLEPDAEVKVRFVYYQPLPIDTGVGRYVYPLEEGGTDEVAEQFWLQNDQVDGELSVHVTLKSVWPVAQVRVPGLEQAAKITQVDTETTTVELSETQATLSRDFVLYYRLADDLPGRIEVVPYRANGEAPGTFMMVVTPGVDLQPITHGADYLFVLDVSGSMQGKIQTVAAGVAKTLGKMGTQDRFRIVTFESTASDLTHGFIPATPESLRSWTDRVTALQAHGSTNLYQGLELALTQLDDDRVTSLVLVTDGVTNTGIIEPRAFRALMQSYDVRVFGFLMGNSANWPLMRLVAETSGGFYAGVSNADDIVGQILLAKSKILHEALHDASLQIEGGDVFDLTDTPRKIYRGQQLVYFGRYRKPGRARVRLRARLTGEDKTYTTTVDFPALDQDNPELERLWALDRIEKLELQRDAGLLEEGEADTAIRDLGIAYQLVTDETSMIVLSEDGFARHNIERKNRERVARETAAQSLRASRPAQTYRVDTERPAFKHRAPRLSRGGGGGGGGGAIDPLGLLLLGGGALVGRRLLRPGRPNPRG